MSSSNDDFVESLRNGDFSITPERIRIGNNSVSISSALRRRTIIPPPIRPPNEEHKRQYVHEQKRQSPTQYPDNLNNYYVFVTRAGKGAPYNRTDKIKLKCSNNPVCVKAEVSRALRIFKINCSPDDGIFAWNEQKLDQKQVIKTPSIPIENYECTPGTVDFTKCEQFTWKQVDSSEDNDNKNNKNTKTQHNIDHNEQMSNRMKIGAQRIEKLFRTNPRELNKLKKIGNVWLQAKYEAGAANADMGMVLANINRAMEERKTISSPKNDAASGGSMTDSMGMLVQLMIMRTIREMNSNNNNSNSYPYPAPALPAPATPAPIAFAPQPYQALRGTSQRVSQARANPLLGEENTDNKENIDLKAQLNNLLQQL